MGEADLLKRVLSEVGFELDFWRVRIRPGSPFSLGFLPRTGREPLPVFGLPGNPGSAFVTFQVLVRPFVLALGGHSRVHRPTIRARAVDPLRSPARLTHFFRVRVSGDPASGAEVRLTGHQSSGLVRSVALADGLAVVPEGVEEVKPGDDVRVLLLGDGPGWQEDRGF